jgi:signal transduction histidine kinase
MAIKTLSGVELQKVKSEQGEFLQKAIPFGLGILGLTIITLAAFQLNLQPGATSLIYLIVVVFVSLKGGLVSSVAVSCLAVVCLNYFFLPRISSSGGRNPLDIVATLAFLFTAWVITGMVARVRRLTEAQMKLRFDERLAERTRIARELHDTLLQSFQALVLHFQVVDDMLPPGDAKVALEKALDRADRAIVEGRAAIQDLRSPATASNDLPRALADLGEELAAGLPPALRPPHLRVSVEGPPHDLYPFVRENVYRIGCEALRNAFQHARASSVEADIIYSDTSIRLRVRDNGKGLDPKHLDAGREGHWGISGMRERARQMGGKLEMWSEVGAGTEVELFLAASIAYDTDKADSK